MSTDTLVEQEQSDSLTTIRFNRPDKLNAVNLDLLRELEATLAEEREDPADALVLTGTGDATCAGMDQDLVTDPEYHEKYHEEIISLNNQVIDHIGSYPGPTILAAKGALVGEAFMFSLYVDFIVAGEETHLSLPEIQYDIDTSETIPTLTQLVGLRAAKEIAMTGEAIPPERALNLGLVNDVVPESEVDKVAQDLASDLAEYDADILHGMKTAMPIEN
jgi:enoyl-CoA hydratase/carnithine racemase